VLRGVVIDGSTLPYWLEVDSFSWKVFFFFFLLYQSKSNSRELLTIDINVGKIIYESNYIRNIRSKTL